MSEAALANTRRIFICNDSQGKPHLVGPDMFPSLELAAAALGHDAGGKASALAQSLKRVEIAFLEDSGNTASPTKPKYRFYYDTQTMGSDGDGTERDPWPDVPTAMAGIERMYRDGTVKPRVGEGILLERREIFTATNHERRKQRSESIAKFGLMLMALMLVAPVLAILGYLLYEAWPALSWEFLTTNPRDAMTAGGIWAPLVGTFFLIFFSLLIAAPIGVLAGVYLNEYAHDNWLTRLINLAVVNLAGVPSIVHALFGVGAFVVAARMGQSLVAASCTLAVMTLPVIITSTREALAAVPQAFREACWNMGASRWQTIRTIVLPNSISGILTGVILQVARAAGETAPILFTGATLYMRVADTGLASYFPYTPWEKVMALSYHLYVLKTQVNNAPEALTYGTAVVLIGLVLAVNSIAIVARTILRSRKKW
ncbi:MAG: phosphate ABC transporter permease PstA [Planctomycetales bacterium]|nr:phosphate ABC transporter permease PstA [Planctomycetales bacterium]MCA9169212.1 phosphate ABC transporter permease PstA [Planctomycetales bacterium]